MFKYGVFSGPYFPVFGLNTEIYSIKLRKSPYSVQMQENTDQKKLCIWTLFPQCITQLWRLISLTIHRVKPCFIVSVCYSKPIKSFNCFSKLHRNVSRRNVLISLRSWTHVPSLTLLSQFAQSYYFSPLRVLTMTHKSSFKMVIYLLNK